MMSEPFDVAAFASEILRKELAGLETLGEALRGDAFAEGGIELFSRPR